MFIDRARVRVTGGAGGNGCCSFRREKYVPRGGPDGGDGGHGGAVYFVADGRKNSLQDVQFHAHWQGERGAHGRGSNCHGRNGKDTWVPVPPGTLIRRLDTDEIVGDLTEPDQQFLAASGGRGGRGNARFVTSTKRAPRFCELGEPGEEHEFILELKLIAEVGLVGLPNAGKSTLLSAVTSASPKVAEYAFTTLSPHLGVARLSDYRTVLMADIPGIIEGAHDGKGLGHDFLRHIERTKVLLFLIDLGDEDPVATCRVLENELEQHSPDFAERPKIYALNKADIPENRERYQAVSSAFERPFMVSAATHEGLPELLERVWHAVDRVRKEEAGEEVFEPEREYTYEPPYTIERVPQGYRVAGKTALRAVRMTDFENEEAVRHLQHRFQRMGLLKALKRMGARAGESIFIGDIELEYQPDE
jgi:GTP-binding protein